METGRINSYPTPYAAWLRPMFTAISASPFGVYAGDTMAGYVMVIYDYDEEANNIWHMMIDKAYQGRDYGQGPPCSGYLAT